MAKTKETVSKSKPAYSIKTAPTPASAPTPSAPSRRPQRRSGLKTVLLTLLAVAVLAGIGFLVKGYMDAKNDVKRLSNPTEASKEEAKELVAKASRLVELPQGEQPTIATVKDVGKLQNQTFFKNAKNGDKVLIYTRAKKAALYRPSTDKIIEVAPVNLGNNSPTTDPVETSPAPSPSESSPQAAPESAPATE